MRTNLNLSPLFRSTIGFDRVFDLLENASRLQTFDVWPPYDILRTGEDSYRITMAVAGFTESELTVTDQHGLLVVAGKKAEAEGEYLHRGIAGSAFERQFELADHVKVLDAELKNGLLSISLIREVPEEMRARTIAIKTTDTAKAPAQIESAKRAA
jgi:molecular chaperone IbpA